MTENVGATRGPVFRTKGIEEAQKFKLWLEDNFVRVKTEAEATSSHLRLKKLETASCGKTCGLGFILIPEKPWE